MVAARGADESTAWRQPIDLVVVCDKAISQLPDLFSAGREAAAALAARPSGAVVVSNEVGLGIVPANPVARRFRDALGAVNAAFAARADRAAFLVAGRVCELGPAAEFMEGIQWRASPASST